MLTDAQIDRYGRQIILPEVGGRGQERLLAARVAVAGVGQAAAAVAMLLGRAGVGTLHVSADAGVLPELSPDCRLHRGAGPTADVAVDVVDRTGPAHDLPFGLEQATRPFVLGLLDGGRIQVLTLVGRPCMRCWLQALLPAELVTGAPDAGPPPPTAHLALGAVAANEVLRVLLSPPPQGRLTTIDLAGGATTRDLSSAGCSCCAPPS